MDKRSHFDFDLSFLDKGKPVPDSPRGSKGPDRRVEKACIILRRRGVGDYPLTPTELGEWYASGKVDGMDEIWNPETHTWSYAKNQDIPGLVARLHGAVSTPLTSTKPQDTSSDDVIVIVRRRRGRDAGEYRLSPVEFSHAYAEGRIDGNDEIWNPLTRMWSYAKNSDIPALVAQLTGSVPVQLQKESNSPHKDTSQVTPPPSAPKSVPQQSNASSAAIQWIGWIVIVAIISLFANVLSDMSGKGGSGKISTQKEPPAPEMLTYYCNDYHQSRVNTMKPNVHEEVQINAERQELDKEAEELEALSVRIKNTTVNEYSQKSVNDYNRLVNRHNKILKSLKRNYPKLHKRSDAFDAKVKAYNEYLKTHCHVQHSE